MAERFKLAQGLRNLPAAAREDLAGRAADIERGKTVELLRRAGKEMYDNLIVNTAIGFTPVLGDVQAAGETMAALNRGAPWQETAGYAAGMLPFVPMIGKTVWHGSPHTFDKFDLSKIGTGEGAQAYGHGLYLAEARPTAEEYAVNLANRDMANQGRLNAHANAQRLVNLAGDPKYAADDIRFALESNPEHPQKQLLQDTLQHLESGSYANPLENTGSLYKVDLPDEQIAKMLDWEKTLSQQPQSVQDALVKFDSDMYHPSGADYDPDETGKWIYTRISETLNKRNPQKMSEMDKQASDWLNQQGIPGIQYLDQASRGAGEGTRNYVVFSDEIPQILERNGQPVAQALRNYGLEHRPMTIEGGASQLHELTPSFGEDVYGKQAMQFFGSGDPREKKALEIMKSVRGNPDAPVTIYRGVPEGVNQINQGDWVTIVPEVAADYGNVISQQVPASHITSWPDSLMEFGYYPPKAK